MVRLTSWARLTTGIAWVLASGCSSGPSRPGEQPLMVYAAASLATVLPKVGEAYQVNHPQVRLEYHFAASSMLAKQIEAGAQADVYFSADTRWVAYLEKLGNVDMTSRVEPIRNRLVLIVPVEPEQEIQDLNDLAGDRVHAVAVGDWTHVPAGRYARTMLHRAGLWDAVKPKLIPAVDVRAALAYVEHADVDCGIVYATDAMVSRRVRVVTAIADSLQPQIRYVAVRVQGARHPLAKSYLGFLAGGSAGDLFAAEGFEPASARAGDE